MLEPISCDWDCLRPYCAGCRGLDFCFSVGIYCSELDSHFQSFKKNALVTYPFSWSAACLTAWHSPSSRLAWPQWVSFGSSWGAPSAYSGSFLIFPAATWNKFPLASWTILGSFWGRYGESESSYLPTLFFPEAADRDYPESRWPRSSGCWADVHR